TAWTSTSAEFASLTQQAAAPTPTAPPAGGGAPGGAPGGQAPAPAVPVPALSISSGYRNPQRNKAAGSLTINSRHTQGRALDLVVANPNATLWARLRTAGTNAGYSSICEDGPTVRPCNHATVDHVHIDW
ncbi:MAG TPA: D-Ala-D-Ala carboxypeptidase family metallohydrolase, partial [Chloroflexia bacterium]|nr:D-Ala-D-Ala carboxypeptidase family metallohydrolase [Chloroflexia bacterium]